eukprot:GEMP01015927.1.p1 GENE.GEMP01015927.1~~GEMP01015927.1.p1  ORF type:complete len:530 (+),score=139.17 GEMP01015927.1:69-1658(+)
METSKNKLSAAAQEAQFTASMHSRGTVGTLTYGTAGFRTDASLLDHVMYRMGVVCSFLSKTCQGAACGVMVTASHNPEKDNGVKIVEPKGEMLRSSWEPLCEQVVNCADNELAAILEKLFPDIDIGVPSHVFVGRDTRPSSPNHALSIIDGASVIPHTHVRSIGVCTTPQLHYCVVSHNNPSYGVPSLKGYCTKFAEAFAKVVGEGDAWELTLDCANGVGAELARQAAPGVPRINLSIVNDGCGTLNEGCGADFVKSQQKPPANVTGSTRCAVFDGDADRLVYCFMEDGKFHLLDGDRIATLFAMHLGPLLKKANLKDKLQIGIVQTAYANGAAKSFAENIFGAENVYCAKTGVKHLHHKALELDIGIYFEANGHGTILFGDKFAPAVEDAIAKDPSGAARELLDFRNLINDTVGDAWTDLLAVEAILHKSQLSPAAWFRQYADLPNRLCKVKVADRTVITTTDSERVCVTPEGLQAKLDALVAEFPKGRSFIRPSGTEDVVRVYAEAETEELVEQLADRVSALVAEFC